MKREIEFRGQRADNKEWVYGYYGRSKIASPSAMFLGEGDVFIEKSFIFNELLAEEVIPETVCQYIGIKDKNGKKVYVGDIIKARHNFYPYTVFVRECKVCIEDEVGNAIRPTTEALKHFESEVIGNIFDKES